MIATVSDVKPAIAVNDDVLRLVEMRIVCTGLPGYANRGQVRSIRLENWIRWL